MLYGLLLTFGWWLRSLLLLLFEDAGASEVLLTDALRVNRLAIAICRWTTTVATALAATSSYCCCKTFVLLPVVSAKNSHRPLSLSSPLQLQRLLSEQAAAIEICSASCVTAAFVQSGSAMQESSAVDAAAAGVHSYEHRCVCVLCCCVAAKRSNSSSTTAAATATAAVAVEAVLSVVQTLD